MNPDQLTLFHVVSLAPPNASFQTFCRDCGANVIEIGERYMVHYAVWPVEKDGGVLCVGCIEARIGRRLMPQDFADCIGNRGYWRRSERLNERMSAGTGVLGQP